MAQDDPGIGGTGLSAGARAVAQRIRDWTEGRIAEALRRRDGRTSLKVNNSQIGLRQHLDVQMDGAIGEDHPELDLARVVLPVGSGLDRCTIIGGHVAFATSTEVTVTLDTALIDPNGWADTANHRITIGADGDYFIYASVAWQPDTGVDMTSGTFRSIDINCSGPPTLQRRSVVGPPYVATLAYASTFSQEISFSHPLVTGQHVSLLAAHDATGNMLIAGPSGFYPEMAAQLAVIRVG